MCSDAFVQMAEFCGIPASAKYSPLGADTVCQRSDLPDIFLTELQPFISIYKAEMNWVVL